MSERKVLNKYYPPDFDPSKIPRLRLSKERQYTVRLMAPCNMRCTTCGEYIYKGKKFNARKETVQNEDYLGLRIYRFYIKCPRCLAEITFKTDPENADYVVELGATRNFQALKLAEEAAAKEAKEKEEEEKNNPMKLLENRTKASKQEMESLEALEEIRDLNQRHAKVDHEQLLKQNYTKLLEELKRQEEEDDEFVRKVFLTEDGERIKRVFDDTDVSAKSITTITDESQPIDSCSAVNDIVVPSSSKKQRIVGEQLTPGLTSQQKGRELLKKSIIVKKKSISNNDLKAAPLSTSKAQPPVLTSSTSSSTASSDPKIITECKSGLSGLSMLTSYSDSGSDSN